MDIVLLPHVHDDHGAGLRNADGSASHERDGLVLPADRDWLSKEIESKAPPDAKSIDSPSLSAAIKAPEGKQIVPGEIVPGVTPAHRRPHTRPHGIRVTRTGSPC